MRRKKHMILLVALVLLFIAFLNGLWNLLKPMPAGTSLEGQTIRIPASQIRFLSDVTCLDSAGRRICRQEIFDQVFAIISQAERFIVLDMFFWNGFQGKIREEQRDLAGELTAALIKRKQSVPDLKIIAITDPINTVYGGSRNRHFEDLEKAGIPVILTDLSKLRDSNPLYSAFWRTFFRFIPRGFPVRCRHPFDSEGERIPLRAFLDLLNFKANHRKVIFADSPSVNGREVNSLVLSANPHTASSAHNNVALLVTGPLLTDLVASEQAVLDFSGMRIRLSSIISQNRLVQVGIRKEENMVSLRVLTEGKIRKALLETFSSLGEGDSLDVAMFYLSDREIIRSLVNASRRGVRVRLILDPSQDAFGYAKNGIPNRQAARDLLGKGSRIMLRWYKTHGEQFHTKLVSVTKKDATGLLFVGSANLTKRNIGNKGLETDLMVEGRGKIFSDARNYFETLWFNRGADYTLAYDQYADTSLLRYLIYRIQETTGLGTF
jgi:phosphatidylserine/phosphatidylglycerophosphate/cardiolipin synthase-like enzyme